MTVKYECALNIEEYKEAEVTNEDFAKAKIAIEKAGYDWYEENGEVVIEGEIEVDEYGTDAEDVKNEIQSILWRVGNIDADVYTKEIEFEPDWDAIYGF